MVKESRRLLFVCSRNRLRSPTAEQVFSDRPGIEVASAGTGDDADVPLTAELIGWADLIVVMEKVHRERVRRRFPGELKNKRVLCLDIPDRYGFMDPELVRLLRARMARHLSGTPRREASKGRAGRRDPGETQGTAPAPGTPDRPRERRASRARRP